MDGWDEREQERMSNTAVTASRLFCTWLALAALGVGWLAGWMGWAEHEKRWNGDLEEPVETKWGGGESTGLAWSSHRAVCPFFPHLRVVADRVTGAAEGLAGGTLAASAAGGLGLG